MKFTKNKAQFEIISAQEIILKSNSVVQSLKDSARETIRTLRAATTQEENGEIKTTKDITFRNISSAAAFVLGSNCNAKKYFSDVNFSNLNNVVNTTTTTTKQEETTTQKQEQTQSQKEETQEEQEEQEQEEENATQENAQQRIQKALEQIEEENKKTTTNTYADRYAHEQTHNASNFKIDLIQRDEELYQELLKILFACGELGNEIQYQGRSEFGTFSTKFYIKDKINALVNNQDFKRFDNRFKSQEEIKQREEKKHLNLILDNSGSYQFNDRITNSIIKTLLDIEKVTRFEFDIYILCNTFYKCEKDKRFCISGADQFTWAFKGLNLVNQFNEITKNNTIFLCDGFINYRFNYSKYHYESMSYDTKNLKALDNNKVAIISDSDNEGIFKCCKNAQVIYSDDYTRELKENIINVFKTMFK